MSPQALVMASPERRLPDPYKDMVMEGFLPFSRASFILDFVGLSMAIITPLLFLSVHLAKVRKQYRWHRRMQTALALLLGLTILVFELDMRINGWRMFAEPSPYYQTLVMPALFLHLGFAIPTLFLWIYTLTTAIRQRLDQQLTEHRARHRVYGRLSAYGMLGTTLSGYLFFWLAFMA